MPPENLNVISDSNFIQRFRWEEKLEGEAAYCLTNLEAAITFLQTVDLASLRAEEASMTPSKTGISKTETFPPAFTAGLSTTTTSPVVTTPENALGTKPQTASSLRAAVQRRRLSDLIQTPAQAIGTASDSFFNTADQGIKTIGNSLNESYRFLLGKLRDSSADGREVIVPRTLDDARKLVGTPSPEDAMSLDDPALTQHGEDVDQSLGGRDDRLFSLVAGKKAVRDHSTDSIRSGRSTSSSKKVVFAEDGREKPSPLSQTPPAASSNPALVESMRNLGSSLNPISRLSSMGMMRGFGRTATTPTPPPKDTAGKPVEGGDLATVCFIIPLN